jgi:hypothetical protein
MQNLGCNARARPFYSHRESWALKYLDSLIAKKVEDFANSPVLTGLRFGNPCTRDSYNRRKNVSQDSSDALRAALFLLQALRHDGRTQPTP